MKGKLTSATHIYLPHPNATSSLCEQLLTLVEGQFWQELRQLYELLQET